MKKTSELLILIPERFYSEGSFYNRIYQKMAGELEKAGFIPVLDIVSRENEDNGAVPEELSRGSVMQCVLIGEMRSSYIEKLLSTGGKLIFFDFVNEEFDVDSITGDNIHGAYSLTRHLAGKGYKKIAFVGSYKATRSILDRLMGYLKFLLAKDMEINNRWIIPDRDKNGYLIEQHLPVEMPEAFICCSDETAYRLIDSLQKYGYKVPENIEVAGYDDYAEHVIEGVRFTTWHVNTDEMIRQCVFIVSRRAEDPGYRHGNISVNGYLVEHLSDGKE
ncbi:MAG: substrate-binding domain-containing protein [Lachnospiraceae bacterium]|nr:substrate-binding domain-containing protein [Lachnospiraceae bacterium]